MRHRAASQFHRHQLAGDHVPSSLPPIPKRLAGPTLVVLPIQPFDPSRPPSGHVSLSQLRRIGAVVVAWGRLENGINDLIWVINGKDMAAGRFDTQDLDITKLLSALQRAISTNLPGKSFENERKAITDIIKLVGEYKPSRNAIVHGTWATSRGKQGVLSLRFETTSDDRVTFEEFSTERMLAVEKFAADAAKNVLSLVYRLEALREKRFPRLPMGESNRP